MNGSISHEGPASPGWLAVLLVLGLSLGPLLAPLLVTFHAAESAVPDTGRGAPP